MRLPLLAALALGCTDYGLNGTAGSGNPHNQTEAPVDDASELPEDTGDTDDTDDTDITVRDDEDVVDHVVQPAEFEVDVLWVVDNSCSMEDDQDRLVTHFPTFIDAFLAMEGLNYHVGVVATDMDAGDQQGRLREANGVRWLDNATADPYGTFDTMAHMGTGGSGDEAGRAVAYHALATHKDGHNAGFIRQDAALSIIVITDEDDSSSLYGVDIDPFVAFSDTLKYDPAMLSYSAIAGPVPDGCATAEPGWQYAEVQERVGGTYHSLCDADWATVLDQLAKDAAAMRREFFLTDIPIVDTIAVRVVEDNGTEVILTVGTDWVYNVPRNSVQLLSYTPPPFSEIFVSYDIDWGASS